MQIYEYGDKTERNILIQPVDRRELTTIEKEVALIKEYSRIDFCLVAFVVEDWNKELSPWYAPAVFGKEDFGDGARNTLSEILQYTNDNEKNYYLGGYSLAGLFALWSAYQTDKFSGIAAVSPSVWFPNFIDYMRVHEPQANSIYLSLGDKEEKTRNPVMQTVRDNIRRQYELLQGDASVKECTFEMNQGNHFREPDIRTAKGFARLLKEVKK